MASAALAAPLARPIGAGVDVSRFRLLAGIPLTIGVLLAFIGLAWDVQWHSDVGPDSFFTAPHAVLYSGVGIAGFTCLAVVLATTWQVRRGGAAAMAGTIPVLGGLFRGPSGFVIGGIGAAMFLAYGLTDQWWHVVYGFDVTLVSPPHVGLILSLLVGMIGCLVAFAAEARRAEAIGRPSLGAMLGVAAAAAILVAFVTPTTLALITDNGAVAGSFDGAGIAIAVLYPLTLLLVASVVRQPGVATLTGVLFTLLRWILWPAIPWITGEYAASIGLFLRDDTSGLPIVPGMMPAYLIVAGLAVDLLLYGARRWSWDLRWVAALAGAVAALLLRLLEPTMPTFLPDPIWPAAIVDEVNAYIAATATPTLLLIPIVGALFGWLGWLVGIVLRQQGYSARVVEAGGPVVAGSPVAAEGSRWVA